MMYELIHIAVWPAKMRPTRTSLTIANTLLEHFEVIFFGPSSCSVHIRNFKASDSSIKRIKLFVWRCLAV